MRRARVRAGSNGPSPAGPSPEVGIDAAIILGGEAVHSQAEFYRGVGGRGAAGNEIPLRALRQDDVHEIKVRSIDRVDCFCQKPTY